MPQYRNRQFNSDNPMHGVGKSEIVNAPFKYPRRVVRSTEIDPRTNTPVLNTRSLDRGYMRSLVTQRLANLNQTAVVPTTKMRFNFQFNPQDIEQSVQMRQDIYLSILQDPSQFAQPMSAVTTFNFDILLDRTMEVGEGGAYTDALSSADPNFRLPDLDNLEQSINPKWDVYQLGVLSDIQVMYSIIGQGFSKDLINSQLEQIKQQAIIDANNNPDEAASLTEIEAITSDQFMGKENIGNSAFLIPMPVRVVFSELFMVDGFVTSTRTVYTKFNTNMVPIQATIGVSMNALYVGFAKEKTFLTTQLQNQLENQLNDINTSLEQNREVLRAAGADAKQFVFALDNSDSWEKGLGKEGLVAIKHYTHKNTDLPRGVERKSEYIREAKAGFKDAKAKGKNDKVLKLFESGQTFTFSYQWTLQIWGPYTNATEAAAAALAGARNNTEPLKPRVGAYTATETASDKDTWDTIRSKSYRSKDPNKGKESIQITTNQAGDKALNPDTDLTGKYFVVKVSVTTSAGGGTYKFDEWKYLGADDKLYIEKKIEWPVVLPGGVQYSREDQLADRPKQDSGRRGALNPSNAYRQ